jgi:hypothetical protein
VDEPIPDLVINCLFILALDAFEAICRAIGKEFPYPHLADRMRNALHRCFFTKRGVYSMRRDCAEYTVLCNALAVLAGVCTGERAREVCRRITVGELCDCSLSTKVLVYDALLMTDREGYADTIESNTILMQLAYDESFLLRLDVVYDDVYDPFLPVEYQREFLESFYVIKWNE